MATIELNKNETKEYQRIKGFVSIDKEYAQRSADIWMRSAPSSAAQNRRKAAIVTLGLSDQIAYV